MDQSTELLDLQPLTHSSHMSLASSTRAQKTSQTNQIITSTYSWIIRFSKPVSKGLMWVPEQMIPKMKVTGDADINQVKV